MFALRRAHINIYGDAKHKCMRTQCQLNGNQSNKCPLHYLALKTSKVLFMVGWANLCVHRSWPSIRLDAHHACMTINDGRRIHSSGTRAVYTFLHLPFFSLLRIVVSTVFASDRRLRLAISFRHRRRSMVHFQEMTFNIRLKGFAVN